MAEKSERRKGYALTLAVENTIKRIWTQLWTVKTPETIHGYDHGHEFPAGNYPENDAIITAEAPAILLRNGIKASYFPDLLKKISAAGYWYEYLVDIDAEYATPTHDEEGHWLNPEPTKINSVKINATKFKAGDENTTDTEETKTISFKDYDAYEVLTRARDKTKQAQELGFDGFSYIDYNTLWQLTWICEHIPPEVDASLSAVKDIKKLDFAIDILSANIWDNIDFAYNEEAKQWQLEFPTMPSLPDAVVMYAIDFNEMPKELHITRHLEPFDQLVHTGLLTLYYNNITHCTLKMLWYAMGNTTDPNTKDKQKLLSSLEKMGYARIEINNIFELEAVQKADSKKKGYGKQYVKDKILDYRVEAIEINGQLVKDAIWIKSEPPLGEFARQRKQITKSPRKLFEVLSKTPQNIRLMFYLTRAMAGLKHNKDWNPVTNLETIYSTCQITTKKQKQRAFDKIKTFMDNAKAINYIFDYKLTKTQLIIIAEEPKKIKQGKKEQEKKV